MEQSKRLITLYEDFQCTFPLTSDEKQGLIELKNVIGPQNVSVQADNSVQIQRYVGFYVNKHIKLQILPKIYSDNSNKVDQNDQISESVKLFFRLLEYTNFTRLKDIPKPNLSGKYETNILEIFITLLTTKFLQQFERSINRNYNTEEDNLILIRGKILFGKSILKNSYLIHRHYCQYDEFTENNLLNRIFKATFQKLLKISDSPDNRNRISQVITHLENVDNIHLTNEVFDKIRFTRLNEDYRPLFNLAKMFYFNCQPGFREGEDYTFTFLIPLNLLFENFVYKLVKKALVNNGLKVSYQGPQSPLAKHHGKKVWPQKPDITVKQQDRYVMILDAKYQNLFKHGEFLPTISNVYQLLSYSVNYQCEYLYIVAPYFKGGEKFDYKDRVYEINNYGRDVKLKFIQLDLNQDYKLLKGEIQKILRYEISQLSEIVAEGVS